MATHFFRRECNICFYFLSDHTDQQWTLQFRKVLYNNYSKFDSKKVQETGRWPFPLNNVSKQRKETKVLNVRHKNT